MKTFLILALATTTAITAHADTTAADAFASLKKLQANGAPAMMKGIRRRIPTISVTAEVSAVEETIFPAQRWKCSLSITWTRVAC